MNDQPMTLEMLAKQYNKDPEILRMIGYRLAELKRETKLSISQLAVILIPPEEKLAGDGRVSKWAVRLFVRGPGDKLEADSDPDRGPDDPGSEIMEGLPTVATWIAELLGAFHGVPAETLANAFTKRLPSLRVALTRNAQRGARWIVAYDAPAEAGKTLTQARFKAVCVLTRVNS